MSTIDYKGIVQEADRQRSAFGLAKLLRKLGIAKLVMATNQVNYQMVYWGQIPPERHSKPILPLASTGIVDSYGVFVPLDSIGEFVDLGDDPRSYTYWWEVK